MGTFMKALLRFVKALFRTIAKVQTAFILALTFLVLAPVALYLRWKRAPSSQPKSTQWVHCRPEKLDLKWFSRMF
jgi:hypothetical protein